ncbi:MAG: cyclic nucleotide-binding domain-containing protein [Candidatus Brocadiaceae bacterium]|nr:cyclic nucleotide-binding domain-containing protein [Candidatus Brocadiaceae bacterium]
MQLMDCRIKKIKDGSTIIKEDTYPYYSYVLKNGKARIMKNVDGRQVVIGALNKGDVFGDLVFLGEMRRSTSVVADGDVTVEMISRETLMDMFQKLPQDVKEKLCEMVHKLVGVTDIYGRMVALRMDTESRETETVRVEEFGTESFQTPELMRKVIISIARRYSSVLQSLKQLVDREEEKHARMLASAV